MNESEPEHGWGPSDDVAELRDHRAQLQAQVDGLVAQTRRLRARITKLETDRDVLRSRLDEARAELRRSRTPSWRRLLHRDVSPPGRAASPEAPPAPQPVRFESAGGQMVEVAHVDPPEVEVSRPGLRVATILDTFSDLGFGYEFDALRLRREDWKQQLEQSDPAFLLVESCFNGNGGQWHHEIAGFGRRRKDLVDLIDYCRARNIPSVFWNKEDPVNYGWFEAAAGLFDHVFTVDAGSVDRYRRALDHGSVHVLPFAAQPVIHHPPPTEAERTLPVGFAGTYYAAKHPERREQMEWLLGAAIEVGLDIFARSHGDDARYRWPESLRGHVRASLSYLQTIEMYRRYRAFLNVNTVTDSPTMCSRRIFELIACGTPVVSTPSRALAEMVPAGLVNVVHDGREARALLPSLLDADVVRPAATEWVHAHTYTARVDQILEVVAS